MNKIQLKTYIKAPPKICFDLSRDIRIHIKSIPDDSSLKLIYHVNNKSKLSDKVKWEVVPVNEKLKQEIKVTMIEYISPHHYAEELQSVFFKEFKHTHEFFKHGDGETMMIDVIEYELPLGAIGRLINKKFMEKYIKMIFFRRNQEIKRIAEKNKKAWYGFFIFEFLM